MTSPFPPSSQVAAYLRDSGGDAQDLSVEQQEAALRAWCAANNLVLSSVFKDLASPGSSTVGRDDFNRLMSYFRKPGHPEIGIVLWKYSRFSRDLDDAAFYKADLRRRGVILHSLNDNIPEGPEGRLIESVIDFMNDRFLEDLRTDVKRGLHHLMQTHGALGGVPPRGFKRETLQLGDRRDGSPHNVSRWVPDPLTWDRCRQAWQMRAAGASYQEINAATHLYTAINSYPTFFTNRLYLGELHFGDQVIPNYAPPLVDQATWDAVQARHTNKLPGPDNPEHPRRSSSSYLLSGYARCAKCHTPLNGRTVKFKSPPSEYHYYHCSRANRHAGCDARKIPAHTLEAAVLDDIHDYVLSPESLAAHQLLLQSGQSDNLIDLHHHRADVATQLSIVRRKLTNLVNAILDAGHTPAIVTKLHALEAEQAQLAIALAKIDHDLSSEPPHLTDEQLLAQSETLRRILRSGDHDLIRTLLHAFLNEILVERDEDHLTILIDYYHPPETLPPKTSEDPGLYAYGKCPRSVTMYTHKAFTLSTLHPLNTQARVRGAPGSV